MKIISWNTANRAGRADQQAAALLDRNPDVVALQEVTSASFSKLEKCFRAGGLSHMVSAVPMTPSDQKARQLGVLIASRFRLSAKPEELSLPWREKGVAAIVESPLGPVEMNTVHVPPGRSHGWFKIDVFEAIYNALAKPSTGHRVLTGDFNAPQAELENGDVICSARRLSKDGQWRLKKVHRGHSAHRWEQGELSVLAGLREFDLLDAFRRVHGYHKSAFSIAMKHRDTITKRRYDHVFSSESLQPTSCDYLHDFRERGLSDHAPLEAVFAGPS